MLGPGEIGQDCWLELINEGSKCNGGSCARKLEEGEGSIICPAVTMGDGEL